MSFWRLPGKPAFRFAMILTARSRRVSASLRARNGERCSASRAYLEPVVASRRNLRVETHAHVTRIVFDGKRAVAVEYRQHGQDRRIRANAEIVLSAGVFQSPQLLMLSGVGDPSVLAE